MPDRPPASVHHRSFRGSPMSGDTERTYARDQMRLRVGMLALCLAMLLLPLQAHAAPGHASPHGTAVMDAAERMPAGDHGHRHERGCCHDHGAAHCASSSPALAASGGWHTLPPTWQRPHRREPLRATGIAPPPPKRPPRLPRDRGACAASIFLSALSISTTPAPDGLASMTVEAGLSA